MKLEFKFSISLKRDTDTESVEQFEHRDTDSTSERADDIQPGTYLPVGEESDRRRAGF